MTQIIIKNLKRMLCSSFKKAARILLNKLMAHKIFIKCTFQSILTLGTKYLCTVPLTELPVQKS